MYCSRNKSNNEEYYFRCSRSFTWRTSLKRHIDKCEENRKVASSVTSKKSSSLEEQSGLPVLYTHTQDGFADGTQFTVVHPAPSVAPSAGAAPFDQAPAVTQISVLPHHEIPLQNQAYGAHQTISVGAPNQIVYVPVVSAEQNRDSTDAGSTGLQQHLPSSEQLATSFTPAYQGQHTSGQNTLETSVHEYLPVTTTK